MIFCRNNCKEYEGRSQRAKRSSKLWNFSGCEISKPKIGPCENGHLLRNHFATLTWPLRNQGLAAKMALRCEINFSAQHPPLRKHLLAHECHFAAQELHFAAAKWLQNPQSVKSLIFAAIAQFRRVFRSCETPLWHTSAISQHNNPISQLRNGLRNVLWKGPPSAKMPFCCEISPPLRKLKWPLVSNF